MVRLGLDKMTLGKAMAIACGVGADYERLQEFAAAALLPWTRVNEAKNTPKMEKK